MTSVKRVAACVGAILAAFAVVYLPYRVAGDPVVAGDYTHHAVSVADFRAAVADGAVYPGWSASVNHGFGAATFYFYPPLPYVAASACVAATGDLRHGLRLTAALAAAFGALGVALLVGASTRGRSGALASAVAGVGYAVLPYALYAAFYRFALAEYCALQVLPWFAWGARDLIERPGRSAIARTVLGAAALAGCHLLTAFVVAPAAALAFTAVALRRAEPSVALRGGVAALLALLLLGAFVVPIVVDHDAVDLAHTQRTEACRYAANLLYDDEVAAGHPRAESKSTMEWIVALETALLVVAFVALRRTRRRDADIARLAAGVALAIGSTVIAEPIWRAIPPLAMLQFPARLIGPLGLLAAWSAGLALAEARRGGRIAVALGIVACAAGGAIVVSATYPSDRPPSPAIDPTAFVLREYAPAATDDDLLVDAWRAHGARAVAVRGNATIERTERTPHRSAWRTDVTDVTDDDGATLWLPRFAHPGWSITIDGHAAEAVANPLGLLACDVPPGAHTVEAHHTSAPSRRIGWWVSLGGLVLTALWLARARRAAAPSIERRPLLPAWLAIAAIAVGVGVLVRHHTLHPPPPPPTHVIIALVDAPPGPIRPGFLRMPATGTPQPPASWHDAAHTLDGIDAGRAWIRERGDEPITLAVRIPASEAPRIDALLQTLAITYRRIDAAIVIRWADGTCDVDPPGAEATVSPSGRQALSPDAFRRAVQGRIAGPDRSADRMIRAIDSRPDSPLP